MKAYARAISKLVDARLLDKRIVVRSYKDEENIILEFCYEIGSKSGVHLITKINLTPHLTAVGKLTIQRLGGGLHSYCTVDEAFEVIEECKENLFI